jgi:hypothetical protein
LFCKNPVFLISQNTQIIFNSIDGAASSFGTNVTGSLFISPFMSKGMASSENPNKKSRQTIGGG